MSEPFPDPIGGPGLVRRGSAGKFPPPKSEEHTQSSSHCFLGRDKSPPFPGVPGAKRLSMPPKPEFSSRMFTLVVCGSTNARSAADVAMFSDFMGIASTLHCFRDQCVGTFLSCFPLQEYFTVSRRADIKFGKDATGNPLFVYSQAKYATRSEMFFTEVTADEIKNLALNWMFDVSRKAMPGDVVNIFFQCHGTEGGDLALGSRLLSTAAIADLVDKYQAGVQVNCVGSHCYSGKLVEAISALSANTRYAISACGPNEKEWAARRSISNRCRNFAFTQPFIQSLAKCKLPGLPQEATPPVTMEQHHEFLKAALRKSTPTNVQFPQTIQHYPSNAQIGLELVESLILRDYVDVLQDPKYTFRRRRMEWPFVDIPVLRRMRSSKHKLDTDDEIKSQVKTVCGEAYSACYDPSDDFMDIDDMGILYEFEEKKPDYQVILNNLYWRARLQSAIFDVFMCLVNEQFVDIRCLEQPVDHSKYDDGPMAVAQILGYFKFIELSRHIAVKPFEGYSLTACPKMWLAIMISRSCADPGKLFQKLQWSGLLGEVDEEKLKGVLASEKNRTWTCNLNWNCGPPDGRRLDFFGSWLPSGLGADLDTYPEQILRCMSRFWKVERLVKLVYDIPDDELVEEAQQDTYLRFHPDAQPRRQYSGEWKAAIRHSRAQSHPVSPEKQQAPRFR